MLPITPQENSTPYMARVARVELAFSLLESAVLPLITIPVSVFRDRIELPTQGVKVLALPVSYTKHLKVLGSSPIYLQPKRGKDK